MDQETLTPERLLAGFARVTGAELPPEPWEEPVMLFAGLVPDGSRPWLYMACGCGWWLGFGPHLGPAYTARVRDSHAERCEKARGGAPVPAAGDRTAQAGPLACEHCRHAPAGVLTVVGLPDGRRRQALNCAGCAAESARHAARLGWTAWQYALAGMGQPGQEASGA